MWKELDRLKRFREGEANKRVIQRRAQEIAARSELEACTQRLDDYRRTAIEREEALYRTLFSRPSSQRDFDELHDDLAALRRGERDLTVARDEASAHLDAAQRATTEAVAEHVLAQRACEKFSELVASHDAEMAVLTQLAEDAEMEESASSRRTGMDIELEDIET